MIIGRIKPAQKHDINVLLRYAFESTAKHIFEAKSDRESTFEVVVIQTTRFPLVHDSANMMCMNERDELIAIQMTAEDYQELIYIIGYAQAKAGN